jgi:hypothetical protein
MAIPFDSEQFLDVFRRYNEATAWARAVLVVAGVTAALLAGTRRRAHVAIYVTAGLWVWAAVAYHLGFFAQINPAARSFAVAFLIEAGLLVWWARRRPELIPPSRAEWIVAIVLFTYALLLYPAIGYAGGLSYPAIPTFGVPCPVTIFTFGILALHARRLPSIVLVVPVLWSLAGAYAAVQLGMTQDLALPAAAVSVIALFIRGRRHEATTQRGSVLLSCGVLSSLLYVAMNVLGAMRWQAYSSLSQTISELSAIGAPSRPLWVWTGILYQVLMIFFGWGVRASAGRSRALRVAGGLLLAYGVIGLAAPFFPMHLRGAERTLTDTMHKVLTMVTVLVMLGAVGFGAAALGKRFRIYSKVTIPVLLVFGVLAGQDAARIDANLPTPWVGAIERIAVGAFLLWIVVLGIALSRALAEEPAAVALAANRLHEMGSTS